MASGKGEKNKVQAGFSMRIVRLTMAIGLLIRRMDRECSSPRLEQNGRAYGAKANLKKEDGSGTTDIFAS